MDSSKCQTSTATPAEPGELPYCLGVRKGSNRRSRVILRCLPQLGERGYPAIFAVTRPQRFQRSTVG